MLDSFYRTIEEKLLFELLQYEWVTGLAFKDFVTGHQIEINQNEIFPSASTIKIHIMLKILQLVEKGELSFESVIEVNDSICSPGAGLLSHLDDKIDLTLRNLIHFMIILSDNTATNILIDLATIKGINELIDNFELENTKIQRKMEDQKAVASNLENYTTPSDCIRILHKIYEGHSSDFVSTNALYFLKKPKKGFLNRALEGKAIVANKPGGMPRVRCDAGIVYIDGGPYALAIMTKFSKASSFHQEHLIVKLAYITHSYMEVLRDSNEYGQGIRR